MNKFVTSDSTSDMYPNNLTVMVFTMQIAERNQFLPSRMPPNLPHLTSQGAPAQDLCEQLYIRFFDSTNNIIFIYTFRYLVRASAVYTATAPANGAWRARKKFGDPTASKPLPPNCRFTPRSSRSLQNLHLCMEINSSRLTQSTPPWQAWRREG